MSKLRAELLIVMAFAAGGVWLWTAHAASPRAPRVTHTRQAAQAPPPQAPCGDATTTADRNRVRDAHNAAAGDVRDAWGIAPYHESTWCTLCPVCEDRPWPDGARFSNGTLIPRYVNLGCSCRWDDQLGESIAPPIIERWPLRPR